MTTKQPKGKSVSKTAPNLFAERIEEFRQLFPETVTESRIDFDKTKMALGEEVDGKPERYSFTWAGKRDAIRLLQVPSRATLVPDKAESVNFDTTQNVFIEGDNLEILKLLWKPYFGRVKMIYIDPPYNTGNDLIYNDNYADPLSTYLMLTGQKDTEGNLLFSNPETSGRYHSAWLSMMYPRLFYARQLLQEDGLIFVSIDDSEFFNLRMIMNEIFGEGNFITTIVWEKIYTVKNDSSLMSNSHEYILLYAKNRDYASIELLPRTEEMDSRYANPDNDPRGLWKPIPLYAKGERKRGRYEIKSPSGKSFFPEPNKHWLYIEDDTLKLIADNRIYFGKDGNSQPNIKRFLSEVQRGAKCRTLWEHDEVGSNDSAKREMKLLFGDQSVPFDFPKPSTLIRRALQLSTKINYGDIVVDFFAGSCTTAQAVLELNRIDGGNRRFVMVQLPEPIPDDAIASKLGYSHIAEVGKERIRRVIHKLNTEAEGRMDIANRDTPEDLGFKVFKLAESNYRSWVGIEEKDPEEYAKQMELYLDPLVDEWKKENVIYEVATKEGYSLACLIQKVDEITENNIWKVTDEDKGQLFYICLDDDIKEDAIKSLELNADCLLICRDKALTDELAANLAFQCNLKVI